MDDVSRETRPDSDGGHRLVSPVGSLHDADARAALAAEVRGDDKELLPLEAIDAGREVVRSTWAVIQSSLAERRAARDEIDEEIRALVSEEELWKPIIRRIENGVQRRPASTSDTPGDSPGSPSASTSSSPESSG